MKDKMPAPGLYAARFRKAADFDIVAYAAAQFSLITPLQMKALAAIFAINVLAFLQELVSFTLTSDDNWHFIAHEAGIFTQIGRWGLDLSYFVLGGGWFVPSLHLLLGLFMYSAAFVIVSRIWGLKDLTSIVIAGAIATTIPYNVDVYAFNANSFSYSLANLLVCIAYLRAGPGMDRLVLPTLMLILAFAIYQTTFNLLAIVGIIHLLRKTLETGADLRAIGRFFWRDMLPRLIVVVAAVVGYLLSVKLLSLFVDVGLFYSRQESPAVESLGDVLHWLIDRAGLLWIILLKPQTLLGLSVKLMFAAVVVLAIAAVVTRVRAELARASHRIGPSVIVWTGLVAALALLSPFMLYAAELNKQETLIWVRYRTITYVGFLLAGYFAIAYEQARIKLVRSLIVILASLLIYQFILLDNRASSVQHFVNQRDFSTAQQIIARARQQGFDFDSGRYDFIGDLEMKLALPGIWPFETVNKTVFDRWSGDYGYMYLVHNIKIARGTEEERAWGTAYACANRVAWPHADSVKVMDGGQYMTVILGLEGLSCD